MVNTPPPAGALALLVVAAGRGVRAGGDIPKQYRSIHGTPLLALTLEAVGRACPDGLLLCVIHREDQSRFAMAAARLSGEVSARLLAPVFGGATRQASVRRGLEALAALEPAPRHVLIHDAARPFASRRLVEAARRAVVTFEACAPGLAPSDAIREVDAGGRVVAALDRAALRAVQTPQAFSFPLILDAHRRAADAGIDDAPDDVAVAIWAGSEVHVFAGDPANVKITHPEDFIMAERRLSEDLSDIRIGQGFDVHAFAVGDRVWLGGVAIAHDRALAGHSDADVLMHAITDAVFGALADGDIGSHFPPSDPLWKGAASEIFLRRALERVQERGGRIAHVDATVICETPKIGPHRDAIRQSLAQIVHLPLDRVAVKATTSERLGFTGRGEGIAAMAVATIRLPRDSNPDRDAPQP